MCSIIILLKKLNVQTVACCCGHSVFKPTIIVHEKNDLFLDIISGVIIPRKKRFYFRDENTGLLFIPEVEQYYFNQKIIK